MSKPPTINDTQDSEQHVHPLGFAKVERRALANPLGAHGNDSGCFSDHGSFWEKDSPSSSVSSVESSRYDVSKLEAQFYYFGIRSPRCRGPKLIFRTSKDVFTAPSGPEQNPRLMRLLPVYEHERLGNDDLWASIRSKIVELLDKRNVRLSSVDLVRFSWVEENEGGEDIEYTEVKVVTTPVTIWVGALPDTLTGEVAFRSSNDILDLLKEHGISDVDVAYRESVVRGFSGPELFAPILDLDDPLKALIDPMTTALGLPIAGLRTLNRQGTMGFYFRVGEELYAVTVRHVLFPGEEGNNPYSYIAGPKKKVVLMGADAFTQFIQSIQDHIDNLKVTAKSFEMRITALRATLEGGGPGIEEKEQELNKTRLALEELEKFLAKMKNQWTRPEDRVIGHVVWAPPISVLTAPHGYTKDVCVVKLDKKKFSQNFRGNVLDLGPEIDKTKFMAGGLLNLRGILSAEEIRKPNNMNHKDEPMRYVIKRGPASLTTIGCLNGFESHARYYFALGSHDSVEAAVHSYDNDSGPFSRAGDSGSIIVDALGKFVALLTSGTGLRDSSDITFGSPFHWLWEIIKAEFPGANLYFEDTN